MPSRRKFLFNSAIGTMSAIGLPSMQVQAQRDNKKILNDPIVISTWDFGQPANREAWKVLGSNGSALDAVEKGVRDAEADPDNNTVGYGGLPDRDGNVTLDACIMDHLCNCGSVMCLQYIMHPVSVARLVMEKTPHIILTGEGALQFALANGFEKVNLLTPESELAWKNWLRTSKYEPGINAENGLYHPGNNPATHDTIGMLALDSGGDLSGACTTSGLAYKMHGRVGDSPVIGAGLYVDNEVGAATATGVGEEVIRVVGAHLIVELMRQGQTPQEACRQAIQRIADKNPEKAGRVQVGFLALNKKGETGAFALHKGFTYAIKNSREDELHTAQSLF